MRRLVESAVLRETGEGLPDDFSTTSYRHRVPLGLILLDQGWIAHAQLQHALEMQRRFGWGRIGWWLVDECGLAEDRVTRALGMQWSCPVLQMDGFNPIAMAMVVPAPLIERCAMLPLRIAAERTLHLAFEDCLNAPAAFALERMTGLKVQSGLIGGTEMKDGRERLARRRTGDAAIERVDREGMCARMAAELVRMQPRASRMVRVGDCYWLRMWLESRAIHRHDAGDVSDREDVRDYLFAARP